mmetsp:Transcript_122604/g.358056  ORF Transcript_122604/g.358056 Transcript_122604/m.358056 type:complete len:111 (+) Transcript_122604:96-428(+)
MAHQRHGKLEGEEHVDYIDKQLQSGAIIRMYQFSMEVSGGVNGIRYAKGELTTSLDQARTDRDRFIALKQKKEARVEKDAASPRSLSRSLSPRSPASPNRPGGGTPTSPK